MRILVLGGGRFQGLRATEMLVESGHAVTVVHRGSAAPPGVKHIAGNLEDPQTLAMAFRGTEYDGVIDNIAYQPDHLERLRPYLSGGAGHYVLISSGVVYHHQPLRSYRFVDESDADLTLESGSAYDVGKRRCEALLRGIGSVPWTVLRFANIDGPGDPSNRRGFFLDRIADEGGLLVPSDVSHPFQPLWRDDASRAAVLAVGNHQAFGQTYNIAGEEVFTLAEWLHLLSEVCGVSPPFLAQLPFHPLRALAGFEYRLPLPVRPLMDISGAQRDLGWRSTNAVAWLPETVQWWRASGLPSVFWEHRGLEIAAINRIRAGCWPV